MVDIPHSFSYSQHFDIVDTRVHTSFRVLRTDARYTLRETAPSSMQLRFVSENSS